MLNEQENLIDLQTIAIEAFSAGDYRSKITKVNGVFYSEKSPMELSNEACMKYASTLEGRKQAVMSIFNYYKPPIIIAPFAVSFFPTASLNSYHCAFIFNHPFKIIEGEKGKTELSFYDKINLSVDASVHTLTQQHLRLHTVINYFRDTRDITSALWDYDAKNVTNRHL